MVIVNAEEWFSGMLHECRDDPRFLAEELVLDVVAAINCALSEQGVSRSDLAQRMGVKPAHVSAVLNGRPNMTLLTVAKFCAALGLRPEIALRSTIEAEQAAGQPGHPGALRTQTPA